MKDPESRPGVSRPAAAESRPGPMRLMPLPDHRHGHRAEVLPDRRVLVFGGYAREAEGEDRGMRGTWIFDPAKGTWARAGDLNTPMAAHASVVVGGVVHAIGGNVERFDAESQTWTIVMGGEPFVASHLGAAAAGSRVLLAGGYPDSRPRLAMLDVASTTWKPIPPYPGFHDQDHFSYVAALDGLFHVAGGFGGADFQPVSRHHAWDGKTWLPRAPILGGDATKFSAWGVDADRRLLIVFGMGGNRVYDAVTDSWAPLPKPPWTGFRAMPACFVADGYLYVLGGMKEDGRTFDVDVYDIVAGRWLAPNEGQ